MKINFSKKQQRLNLIFGCLWLSLFIVKLFLNLNQLHWLNYGWLVIGLAYLGLFAYQKKYPYLYFYQNRICKNGPLGKLIYYHDVTEIKEFAGDFTLKTHEKELKINGQLIDKASLPLLHSKLEQLRQERNLT